MAIYIKIEEVVRIVKQIRSLYPEDVFVPVGQHKQGEEVSKGCYAAEGARLACDSLLEAIKAKQQEPK